MFRNLAVEPPGIIWPAGSAPLPAICFGKHARLRKLEGKEAEDLENNRAADTYFLNPLYLIYVLLPGL